MSNPSAKLREANFFLDLLARLEATATPLVPGSAVQDELSFLLSALLNALYAATEHLKPRAGQQAVKGFKKEHPLIFDGRTGLRNLTVHERHVSPAPTHYIAPRGSGVDLVFSEPAIRVCGFGFPPRVLRNHSNWADAHH